MNNADYPFVSKEILEAWQEAVLAGDDHGIATYRTAIIEAVQASALLLQLVDQSGDEARLFARLIVHPRGAEIANEILALDPAQKFYPPLQPASRIMGENAPAMFRVHNRNGTLWPVGAVALLAGEGGAGKSTLAGELALSVASYRTDESTEAAQKRGDLDQDRLPLRVCRGGPVLWLAYEEQDALLSRRLRLRARERGIPRAPERIYVRDLSGDESGSWPLFGPKDRGKSSGLYNARPERLRGWDAMRDGLRQIKEETGESPAMIVVDPLLAAYVGKVNAVPPVREFVGALGSMAKAEQCGVLLLAHATKEGGVSGPFDRRQVGGSAAWTDAVRCAMTLTWGDGTGVPGGLGRTLAVLKANVGPSNIWTPVAPVRPDGATRGWVIGFERSDPAAAWFDKDEWVSDKEERVGQRKSGRTSARPGAGHDRTKATGAVKEPALGRPQNGNGGSPLRDMDEVDSFMRGVENN